MIGIYIRFMADVNKNSEKQKRKEIMNMLKSLKEMPKRFPFSTKNWYLIISTTRCLLRNVILFYII